MCATSVWRGKSGEISIWNLIQMLKTSNVKKKFPGFDIFFDTLQYIFFFLQFGENGGNREYYFDLVDCPTQLIYIWIFICNIYNK